MTAFIILFVLMLGWPGQAQAHAQLERSVPEANTRVDAAPAAVELYFNEAIEAKAGALSVRDSSSKKVTGAEPKTGEDRRSLTLAMPSLGEGVYTVSYAVISADGHPVNGSFVFVVGNPQGALDASSFDPHNGLDHSGHEGHEYPTQLSGQQFFTYVLRIIYYLAVLLAAGFMLWEALHRGGEAMAALRRRWELPVVRALFIAVLLYIFIHAAEILRGYEGSDYFQLFTGTSIGRVWIALFVLSAAGFAILKLGRTLRTVWALLLLGVESWSGHAAVFKPAAATVILDFIHLAASAVWVGGLALLLAFWLADRKEAGRFAPVFSRMALLSILLLIASGTAMTLLFMPGLNYLFYTAWGKLLIAKTALVVLVVIIGALLRLRVRRGELPNFTLLRIDIALMLLIMIIVGIFTYVTPLPANANVYYHKMGAEMHLTLRITPNKPASDNKFRVNVWLPEQQGEPKSIVLRLKSLDREDVVAINVPLVPFKDNEIMAFEGYTRSDYVAEGPYIPFAGRWKAEVRVLDKDDNEKVERYEFRNY